jgi:hypothetical protein
MNFVNEFAPIRIFLICAPSSEIGNSVAVDVPGLPIEHWEAVSGLEITTRFRLHSIRCI